MTEARMTDAVHRETDEATQGSAGDQRRQDFSMRLHRSLVANAVLLTRKSIARELRLGRPIHSPMRSQIARAHRYRIAVPEIVDGVDEAFGAHAELAVAHAVELVEWISPIHLHRQ